MRKAKTKSWIRNARLRDMIIQGVLKRTDTSLRAIWKTRRVDDSVARVALLKSLASVGEEYIFQTNLLQPDTFDLEPAGAKCVDYLWKKKCT